MNFDRHTVAYQSTKEYSEEIVQVLESLGEVDHNILIANSKGLYTTDRRIRTRIAIQAVASDGTENQVEVSMMKVYQLSKKPLLKKENS